MNQQRPPQPPPWQGPPAWQPPPEQPGPAAGVQFAPHGERLIAYIIDSLIVSVVLFITIGVLFFAIILPGIRSGAGVALGVPFLLLTLVALIVGFAYFPFFWVRGGQTPGMKAFDLYVVRDRDGGPIDLGQAILRLVGFWIDGIAFYLGFIWVFIDSRRRAWHDLIAGTVVVKR